MRIPRPENAGKKNLRNADLRYRDEAVLASLAMGSARTRPPTGDARMGARIKAKRRLLGWTQEDLARKIGKEQHSVSSFETGAVMPEPETLDAIALALDERLDHLRGLTQVAQELEDFETAIFRALSKKALRRLKDATPEKQREIARDLNALIEARLDDPQADKAS